MDQITTSLASLQETGESAVLCIVISSKGSTPRKAGSKMLVFANGSSEGTVGGGRIEYLVIEEAKKMLFSDGAKTIDYDLDADVGMQCGGKMSIYFESLNTEPRLLIFGAGHIGKVLASMAQRFPFRISLIDDREGVFDEKMNGVECINEKFPEAYKQISYRESDFVVVATYKHTYDEEIVTHVLPHKTAYIGMIASKRKAALAKKKWSEQGLDDSLIEKVYTPIGLSIHCETPEDIALSILAQMVDKRNKLFNKE